MIHYHGLPITPADVCSSVLAGGHAFLSYANPEQATIAIDVCQSFAIDNGAFVAWRSGNAVDDWSGYYEFARGMLRIPNCDFAVIPDVIGGTDEQNDALAAEWPLPQWFGAPVWHLNASLDRLERLINAGWPRICIGSAGEYARIGNQRWWQRMDKVMSVACDDAGRPRVRLHGLRMLDPEIYSRLPFASADSTNIGRNIGIDCHWRGTYTPATKLSRAQVLRTRIESANSPATWTQDIPAQKDLLCSL